MRLLAFTSLIALLAVGCEHGIDVTGHVTIPADVQQLYSEKNPGLLVVQANVPADKWQAAQHVAVLCAAQSTVRSVDVSLFDFGCAQKGKAHVRAWTEPAPAGIRCADGPSDVYLSPNDGFATSDARAEGDFDVAVAPGLGACADGSIKIALTVEKPSP